MDWFIIRRSIIDFIELFTYNKLVVCLVIFCVYLLLKVLKKKRIIKFELTGKAVGISIFLLFVTGLNEYAGLFFSVTNHFYYSNKKIEA